MGARRAARKPLLPRLAVAVLALGTTVGVVFVGVEARRPQPVEHAAPPPKPSPSRFEHLDLSKLPVARQPFCGLLQRSAVETALQAPVAHTDSYGSGDRARIAPGFKDIADEFSCSFDAATGTEARAWLFASPVQTAEARRLARQARREPGCRRTGAPTFGTPSVATTCTTRHPSATRVTLRGLFGDAWLSCQLQAPTTADLTGTERRADQWCVSVATTLGARP